MGKTSLALECAHRLPRALWFSAWPGTSQSRLLKQLKVDNLEQLVTKLEEDRLCLFVDHGKVLEGAAELLAWASHHLRGAGLVVICDRRLRLSPSARVSQLNLAPSVPGTAARVSTSVSLPGGSTARPVGQAGPNPGR